MKFEMSIRFGMKEIIMSKEVRKFVFRSKYMYKMAVKLNEIFKNDPLFKKFEGIIYKLLVTWNLNLYDFNKTSLHEKSS